MSNTPSRRWRNPASATNGQKGGRPPATTTIRVGERISIRLGRSTEPITGLVQAVPRGQPRSVAILLDDGEECWIWFGPA